MKLARWLQVSPEIRAKTLNYSLSSKEVLIVANWNPVTQKPEKSGNYLVALREDNSLAFNHKEPIIAQFGYQYPENWSAYDQFMCTHTIFDCDVLWWSELPEVPKNPPLNVWIEWVYTEENPFPKLDGDPLVHVRFKDGSASTDDGIGVRPISGWHDNGDKANCFEQGKHLSKTIQIIAYLLVDPNDHD